MTQFMPANASESNDNEVQLVGMSYNLGSHHVGITQEYSSIMPPISTTMLAFYDNQFLFEIPQSVWELVVMPILGAAVLGKSRSICKFFERMHNAFVANGVLQVSNNFDLRHCLNYVRTLCQCATVPESTFKINVPAGTHEVSWIWPNSSERTVNVNVELIGSGGHVYIVDQVEVDSTVKVIFRNICFKKGLRVRGSAHVRGCTFSNDTGNGAECWDGGVMRAFHSVFSSCENNGLFVKGQRVTASTFSTSSERTLLNTPQSYQMTFNPSTFIGHNCTFENNNSNGIKLKEMVNLFLSGIETSVKKNRFFGISGIAHLFRNNSIQLSRTLPQNFCGSNGEEDDVHRGNHYSVPLGDSLF